MKKRLFAFAMLASLLMASACGSETTAPADGTADAGAADTTAAVTDNGYIADDLPEADYGGYEFRIMCDPVYVEFIYSEGETGVQINDMVYESNRAVEERFNVKLSHVPHTEWTNTAEVQKPILAGDDAFDICFMHDIGAGNLSLENLFHNLYEVPHLNFNQPWWPKYSVDSMTINGRMYLISNCISYYGFHATRTMFFNRDLIEKYDMESPYDLVLNDQWTLDKLIEMSKDVYEDTNGNSAVDYTDIRGFAMTVPYCLFENFGHEAWGKNADGSFYLDTYNDRSIALMDKLVGWLCEGNPAVYYSNTHSGRQNEDSSAIWFSQGNLLFTYGAIGHQLPSLTNSDINYGILPMPKVDASQEDYICACCELPGVVPITASDIDRTGMIIEAMSAEAYRTVYPNYYEYALKGRYANDEESVKMIDIMFENRVLSYSYIYGGSGGGLQQVVNNVLTQGGNFASYYEKNAKKDEKRIEQLNEFFTE
ncbi:MAG: carbohydrate ABC transporter substrate-binding protein [Ruminococcaceae bacterium]|nr:carbohydrate ABC transporter substrate-binding protein [Oscillospiraceae bacterium]